VACSNQIAKGHLAGSARDTVGLPSSSVYENLNSTEPDIRSRLNTTSDIDIEETESQLQTQPRSHRKAVNTWLPKRKSKASPVYCVAADMQDVVKAASFIGCQRRFHRPVLKHAQNRHRETVSMPAENKLFQ
jgi:hypothetical protein